MQEIWKLIILIILVFYNNISLFKVITVSNSSEYRRKMEASKSLQSAFSAAEKDKNNQTKMQPNASM